MAMGFRMLCSLTASACVWAASVNGKLVIPEGFVAQADSTPSMWLLENRVVPIVPPLEDPRSHMVVVLDGRQGATMPPGRATMRLVDMRLSPRVVAIGSGSTIDFQNDDHVSHTLYSLANDRIPATPQAPGASRTVKLTGPGVYELRCKEVPHIRGTILALAGGRFAVPVAGGAFAIDDVPPGLYHLRVWYAGKNIHSQNIGVQEPAAKIEITLAPKAQP